MLKGKMVPPPPPGPWVSPINEVTDLCKQARRQLAHWHALKEHNLLVSVRRLRCDGVRNDPKCSRKATERSAVDNKQRSMSGVL